MFVCILYSKQNLDTFKTFVFITKYKIVGNKKKSFGLPQHPAPTNTANTPYNNVISDGSMRVPPITSWNHDCSSYNSNFPHSPTSRNHNIPHSTSSSYNPSSSLYSYNVPSSPSSSSSYKKPYQNSVTSNTEIPLSKMLETTSSLMPKDSKTTSSATTSPIQVYYLFISKK